MQTDEQNMSENRKFFNDSKLKILSITFRICLDANLLGVIHISADAKKAHFGTPTP